MQKGITTTQATSKRLKAQWMGFVALFIIGMVWIATIAGAGEVIESPFPFALVVGGVVGALATKVQMWWHHG